MSLEQRINEDLKSAMKRKDAAALRGIRAIKAAILLANTDGSGKALDEAAEVKLLQKLVKQRRDSLEIYEQQNRPDLAQTEREEIDIIQRYLPEQMGEEELRVFINQLITELGATGMKDMGRVMGQATQRLAGKANGKLIAAQVKAILSAS